MPLLVINHHYVRPEQYSSGIYPISPEQLKYNVEQLLHAGWQPVALEEVLQQPERCFGQKSFLITFDDGLKCSFQYGKPVLDALGIRAAFFVSTSVLQGKVLFVHKLHFVRSRIPDPELMAIVEEILGEPVYVDESKAQRQYRYDDEMARTVKYFFNFVAVRQPQLREEIMNRIMLEYLHTSEKDFHQQWYMDADELRALRDAGHSVGSHGHTHVPLAQLGSSQIQWELRQAQEILGALLGEVPIAISYPYGGPTAVSELVYQLAEQVGLQIGFTMRRNVNFWQDWVNSPLALQRIDVKDISFWCKRV